MFWWVFLGLILFLVITVLFAPIRLYINTRSNIYFVSWGDVVKAAAQPIENDIDLSVSAFGLSKHVTLLKLLSSPTKDTPKKARKKKKRTSSKLLKRLIGPIIRSFKIKQLYANLDFHSVYWNSWLYPWGYIFYKENIHCTTNFEGKEELVLEIVNRPFWLVQEIIKKQLKT